MAERSSYNLHFKLNVLKKLEEFNGNVSETARFFKINRKNIQRWRNQQDIIKNCNLNRTINTRVRKRNLSNRSQNIHYLMLPW